MTTLSAAEQLKSILELRTWDGVSGTETVFATGSVLVAEGPHAEFGGSMRCPAAIIEVGSSVSDPEEPRLIVQTFDVTVLVGIPGDAMTENSILGANITSDTGTAGKGLLHVEVEVKAALNELNQADGIQVIAYSTGDAAAAQIDELGFVAFRTYSIDAQLSSLEQ